METVLQLLSVGAACLALAFAVWAVLIANAKGPPAWSQRLTEAETAIADLHETLDSHQRSLAKWRARVAARDRRAEPVGDDSEPDPVREPDRWKAWFNSGGRRRSA